MSRLRAICRAAGLEPVYHYTKVELAHSILTTGFRMSTQGQGDGGVYFSVRGPSAYGLGTDQYEENIILDCFGVERLGDYLGKGMLDLCVVYAAEPRVLTQAPGGRDNAKMVAKSSFQALALRSKDGNFFLRPDRIIGAFVLTASMPPLGYGEAKEALAAERAADEATKQRLGALEREMTGCGEELRMAFCPPTQSSKASALKADGTSEKGGIEMQAFTSPLPHGVDVEIRHHPEHSPTAAGLPSESCDGDTADLLSAMEQQTPCPRPDSSLNEAGVRGRIPEEATEHERLKTQHILHSSLNFKPTKSSGAARAESSRNRFDKELGTSGL